MFTFEDKKLFIVHNKPEISKLPDTEKHTLSTAIVLNGCLSLNCLFILLKYKLQWECDCVQCRVGF